MCGVCVCVCLCVHAHMQGEVVKNLANTGVRMSFLPVFFLSGFATAPIIKKLKHFQPGGGSHFKLTSLKILEFKWRN